MPQMSASTARRYTARSASSEGLKPAACFPSACGFMLPSIFGRSWLPAQVERQCERQPEIPAGGAILFAEFPIALDVHVALFLADRKEIADLRANPCDARFE